MHNSLYSNKSNFSFTKGVLYNKSEENPCRKTNTTITKSNFEDLINL